MNMPTRFQMDQKKKKKEERDWKNLHIDTVSKTMASGMSLSGFRITKLLMICIVTFWHIIQRMHAHSDFKKLRHMTMPFDETRQLKY